MEGGGEMFSFLLCLLYYILAPHQSVSCTQSLMFNYGKTQQLKQPQQNNIQPTSHLGTTWQAETLKYGIGWRAQDWKGVGGAVRD